MKVTLLAILLMMASNSFAGGLQKGCTSESAQQASDLNVMVGKLFKDGSASKLVMMESSINNIKASYCAGLTPKAATCSRLKEEFKNLIKLSTISYKAGLSSSSELFLAIDQQRDVVNDCME